LHPEVLAGMSELVDLDLDGSWVLGDSAGVAALLALPAMQQFKKLRLGGSLQELLPADLQSSQYSVLTSSWQLSSLSLNGCVLPAEAPWASVFDRQLATQQYTTGAAACHTRQRKLCAPLPCTCCHPMAVADHRISRCVASSMCLFKSNGVLLLTRLYAMLAYSHLACRLRRDPLLTCGSRYMTLPTSRHLRSMQPTTPGQLHQRQWVCCTSTNCCFITCEAAGLLLVPWRAHAQRA
jgi:hypothetical protein